MVNFKIFSGIVKIQDFIILHKVEFKLNPGEIILLKGDNGVGKSSLFNAIFKKNNFKLEGDIQLNSNLNYYEMTTDNLFQHGYYFISQENIVIENLTYRRLWELLINEKEELDEIDFNSKIIVNKIDYGIGTCSGGENRIMEFAPILFLSHIHTVFIDEIDSGLNQVQKDWLSHNLKNLSKKGLTFFIITHDNQWLTDIANKTLECKNGELSCLN